MSLSSLKKCSNCRTSGHTKRTCLLPNISLGTVCAEQKKAPTSGVVVRVAPSGVASSHVIELRQHERHDLWRDMPIFQEHVPLAPPKREVIDFAAMVERANETSTFAVETDTARQQLPLSTPVPFEGWSRLKSRLNELFLMKRLAYGLMSMVILLSIPFPAFSYYQQLQTDNQIITEKSVDGFTALRASTLATLSANFGEAGLRLNDALDAFATANFVMRDNHGFLLSLLSAAPFIGTQISSREHLLAAGQHVALGNTYLMKGLHRIEGEKDTPLTDRIMVLRNHLHEALPQYRAALLELQGVDAAAIPEKYRGAFREAEVLFTGFIQDMSHLEELGDAVGTILGNDSFRRYMVIFQNQSELRPTGGFMGSYAIIDVQKGKMLRMELPGGGTYDIQGQLTEYVEAPQPLQLVNARFEFQDANWFPDFPASAKKISWFYEHARHTTVDGVIAINASVLERLLRVIGPVENSAYGVTLTTDNALSSIQTIVESDEARATHEPKAIMAEIMNTVLDKIGQAKTGELIHLLGELHAAATEKEIQVYMNDAGAEKTIRDFGWAGSMAQTGPQQDYLSVIHANIGGQKSDAKMIQTIDHQAVVSPDGSIIDTVILHRTHTGRADEPLTGVPNIDYVRIYVPLGATLIDAGGFTSPRDGDFKVAESWYKKDPDLASLEVGQGIHIKTGTRITREFDKTAFGNWMITYPGQSSEVFFTYRLPFSVRIASVSKSATGSWPLLLVGQSAVTTARYSLYLQKQSGVDSHIHSSIIYPEGFVPLWRSDEALTLANNGATYEADFTEDTVIALLTGQIKK